MNPSTSILRMLNHMTSPSSSFSQTSTIDGNSQVQNVGSQLEWFIKDSLSGTESSGNPQTKQQEHTKVLSYLGGKNHPPDMIIRGGAALEIKKISNRQQSIQLNSSMPKRSLKFSDSRITQECRDCEPYWVEKDLIYVIGAVDKGELTSLFVFFGDCYVAQPETYEKVLESIDQNFKTLGLTLSRTNELARINGVDPLNRSQLRVRGMWTMNNPQLALKLNHPWLETDPLLSDDRYCLTLMTTEKYLSHDITERTMLEENPDIDIIDFKIPDPDTENKSLSCKLIRTQMKR